MKLALLIFCGNRLRSTHAKVSQKSSRGPSAPRNSHVAKVTPLNCLASRHHGKGSQSLLDTDMAAHPVKHRALLVQICESRLHPYYDESMRKFNTATLKRYLLQRSLKFKKGNGLYRLHTRLWGETMNSHLLVVSPVSTYQALSTW